MNASINSNVKNSVDQLISSIKQSEVYRQYEYCEEQLTMQPEVKEEIDNYRISAYRMNQSLDEDLYDEADKFEQAYEKLRRNPKVNAYLEAELALCRLLQKISVRIDSEVGLSVPEL